MWVGNVKMQYFTRVPGRKILHPYIAFARSCPMMPGRVPAQCASCALDVSSQGFQSCIDVLITAVYLIDI